MGARNVTSPSSSRSRSRTLTMAVSFESPRSTPVSAAAAAAAAAVRSRRWFVSHETAQNQQRHQHHQQRRQWRMSSSSSTQMALVRVVYFYCAMLCLFQILCTNTVTTVQAYSTGAGSCIGGQAAVGGSHLESSNGQKTIQVGELYQGGVTVAFVDTPDVPWIPQESVDAVVTVQTQTDYTIVVATSNVEQRGFVGVLLRLSGSGSSDSSNDMPLTIAPVNGDADTTLQDATVCMAEDDADTATGRRSVMGVTHRTNAELTSVTAVMRFDAPGTATLDVTMVGANTDSISVYGYNGFRLVVQGEAAAAEAAVAVTDTTPAPIVVKASLAPGETYPPTQSPTVADIMGTLSPTYTSASAASAASSTTTTSGAAVAAVVGWPVAPILRRLLSACRPVVIVTAVAVIALVGILMEYR